MGGPAAPAGRDTKTDNAGRPTILGDGGVSDATGREPYAKRNASEESKSWIQNPDNQILKSIFEIHILKTEIWNSNK